MAVARYGVVSCVTDTGGATARDLVIIGTGTVVDCKDSGQTASSSISMTTRITGVFLTSASAGATALVELAPAHFGSLVSSSSMVAANARRTCIIGNDTQSATALVIRASCSIRHTEPDCLPSEFLKQISASGVPASSKARGSYSANTVECHRRGFMNDISVPFVRVEIYFDNLERAKKFYVETLGLRCLTNSPVIM